ncbi:MAG: metallophosphoesterase family protein [Dongiaceae bacterium]
MARLLGLICTVIASLVSPSILESTQLNSQVLVGAGDIASCNADKAKATAKLLDNIPGMVFTTGDHAYPNSTAQEFIECYGPSWGRHKHRTRPAPGNHDYDSKQAAPYFKYFGTNAGPAGQGFYSYDLGAWHIVSLNSNTNAAAWGREQEAWLRHDLAANATACTLAYWHHPYVSSGKNHGNSPHMRTLVEILFRYAVDVAVTGHDHIYERFAPLDANGKASVRGIRHFIVGTGGAGLYEIGVVKPNSEVRATSTHGVLKFTLHASSYDWEFIPIAGRRFRDRGSAQCHGGASRAK